MKLKNTVAKLLIALLLTAFIIVPNQLSMANAEDTNVSSIEAAINSNFVPGQVIVAFKDNTEVSAKSINALSDVNISSIEELTKARAPANVTFSSSAASKKLVLINLKSAGKQDVIDVIRKLEKNPNIEYAEPNYIISINSTVPNDPYFSSLYGMKKISAPQAWDKFTGSPSVVVGVIDTGIDYTHQDLSANMWVNPGEIAGNGIDDDKNGYIDDIYGWDFADNDNTPMDDNMHGTHCAGTIAGVGNNGIGVAGVSWNTKVAALKVVNSSGSGSLADAIKAIDYANKMGFPITSNSWSGGPYTQALHDVIAASGLFIASAGNNGRDNDTTPRYPASYDCSNIIAVAATDSNDNLASFSNYGKNSVDIAAPGVGIWSCAPGNSYKSLQGTSMATPHVAGAVALLKGFKPNLSTLELKNLTLNNVDKLSNLSDKVLSGGRLNVFNMLPKTTPSIIDTSYIYKIVSKANGRVIDADANNPGNGGIIHQWEYLGVDNQKWRFESLSDGSYKIVSKAYGNCIDADNNKPGNGGIIQQWEYLGGSNQQWILEIVK